MNGWARHGLFYMLFAGLLLLPPPTCGESVQLSCSRQAPTARQETPRPVEVVGRELRVKGVPFVVRGIGYAPTPIGDDPSYPPHGDYFTSGYAAGYERDLALLRTMGANTVRLWGWQVNADHTGFLDAAYNGGVRPIYVIASYWIEPGLDLLDTTVRASIKAEFVQMVALHRSHPAILMWAIGNELNGPWMYGDSSALFTLIEEMAQAAHAEEGADHHPVTTPLADVGLIATIAARDAGVPSLDVWSVQAYRGASFGSLFADYAAVSTKPLVITEYGIDAYDDGAGEEYELHGPAHQALYAASLWGEIAAHRDVCAGGSLMAYSDEWWKGRVGQTDAAHSDCPDANAGYHSDCGFAMSSHPDGYANEEWWGMVRRIDNGNGVDILQPRAVYGVLKSLWTRSLYLPLVVRGVTPAAAQAAR
ncbi:MAG: hypothetical protein MUF84_13565 [Anaerolineae bacterium]|nr:hypothetical protein [Anaerolineae bacterium]